MLMRTVTGVLLGLLIVSALAVSASGHEEDEGVQEVIEEKRKECDAFRHAQAKPSPLQGFKLPFEIDETATVPLSIGASLATSLLPIGIIILCPSAPSRGVLHALLAFAAGSLLGDAMLHLLPHSMDDHHHHHHHHDHHHDHGHHHHEHDHGHHHHATPEWLDGYLSIFKASHVSLPHLLFLVGLGMFFVLEKLLRLYNGGHSHSHSHSPQKKAESHLRTAAFLNLLADTAHNFTDGVTIAAGFSMSYKVGISTTVAVFIHEIPHEVGDYAVLVGSGFGKGRAMLAQVVTAIGNLAGTAVMLYAGHLIEGAERVVLPISAGGFVYIAAVNILPELLTSPPSLWSLILETLLIALGIFCMVLIGLAEGH